MFCFFLLQIQKIDLNNYFSVPFYNAHLVLEEDLGKGTCRKTYRLKIRIKKSNLNTLGTFLELLSSRIF